MTGTDGSCGAHAGISDDLRGTALHLLERLRVAVEPLRADTAAGDPEADGTPPSGSAGACTACPVCALVAVLRGERSELATRLAEHATGLLAVLTAVLEETGEHAARPSGRSGTNGARPHGARPHGGRSVQRIVVHRS
ncbi:hypothetical protein ACLFMI_11770 [Pseudonocardia nantongensis]|uniref:hypothetical protein n=1 Tax=Pseudonocardia nantongensis TaxID=1181885 RepID=UPI00397A253D